MHGPALTFLLVPDTSAARRIRRLIAARGAGSGLIAGTWPELVARAQRTYLVPDCADNWEERLGLALSELQDAFWSESLAVAPVETREALTAALVQIASATDPRCDICDIDEHALEALPERPRRRLADLLRLMDALAGSLPRELSTIRHLLAAGYADALHGIRVVRVEGIPALSRWQAALVEKLNRDLETEPDGGIADLVPVGILSRVLGGDCAARAETALGALQGRLFADSEYKAELDATLQWIGVRDYLQEVEVAAGMVQRLLAECPELKPAEIGLLVPERFEYPVALEAVFRLAGLALSGLPLEKRRRDLGSEAVFHFLYCRDKPAPAMALAACLTSPLMPWSREQGAILARTVMGGDARLRPPPSFEPAACTMLDLLRGGGNEPGTLGQALRQFVALLGGGEEFAAHLQRARSAVERLLAMLDNAGQIDWPGLRRAVSPGYIPSAELPDFNLEGITVWREGHEPWRAVRHMIVLGFAQGRYPQVPGSDPVVSADDIRTIRTSVDLPLSTPAEELTRRRQRFRRQLAAVSETMTFLIPRRDPAGAAQAPSESLVFMCQLFTGPESADELIIELDAADDRLRVRHLALADHTPPRPPRLLLAEDLRFERDLLALRADVQGQVLSESPSSLETLMISRLAWLLRRLGAEPWQWTPESVDGALLGSLAHDIFEGLFRAGENLPARDEIERRVEHLLEEAIARLAPFLGGSLWQLERRHFAAETARAAQAWWDMLERLGAEVLASEAWLRGIWSGIPICGRTDLILGLPGKRLLVVDYKRAGSGSRRQRMEKGYDCQASLYRAMLQHGFPRDSGHEALHTRFREAARSGIVYYMLNDRMALSDAVLPESTAIPGWQTLENDIAEQAMALIRRRLAELRKGKLQLNREGDAEFFEKQAGIRPYALANSPLISLFTLPGKAVEAQ